MKKRILAAALMMFVIATQLAFAAVVKEYTFTTTDADYAMKTVADLGKGDMKDIPKIVKNGWLTASSASSITYTLQKKVEPEKIVYENLATKELPDDAKTVKKKGKVLKLVDTKWEENKRTPVTGHKTITDSYTQPSFPATAEMTATLDDGTRVTAMCNLINVQQDGGIYKKPFTVTAKFTGDSDVDYYIFGGREIPNNPNSPEFEGYEKSILQALGLNPAICTLSGGRWTTDYKTENGNTVRYAEFTGTRQTRNWKAYYSEKTTGAASSEGVGADQSEEAIVNSYTATCIYGSEDTIYTVIAKVIYDHKKLTTLGIITTACVGIAAFAALVAVLLLAIKRKKEQRTENI